MTPEELFERGRAYRQIIGELIAQRDAYQNAADELSRDITELDGYTNNLMAQAATAEGVRRHRKQREPDGGSNRVNKSAKREVKPRGAKRRAGNQ